MGDKRSDPGGEEALCFRRLGLKKREWGKTETLKRGGYAEEAWVTVEFHGVPSHLR